MFLSFFIPNKKNSVTFGNDLAFDVTLKLMFVVELKVIIERKEKVIQL